MITLLLLSQLLLQSVYAQIPPDISVTDIRGNKHQLHHALEQGFIIFLDFSFIDCQPCNEALPEINQIVEDYTDQNILLWYISDRDNNEELTNYSDALNNNAVIVGIDGDGEEAIEAFSDVFNFYGFPTMSIICPNKNTTWDIWPYSEGAPEWRVEIEGCQPMIPLEEYEPYEVHTNTEEWEKNVSPTSLSPIPFPGMGVLKLDLKKSGIVNIGLYDYQMRFIAPLYQDFHSHGQHDINIHTNLYQNGYYLLKIETPQGIEYLPFIKG